MHSNPLYEVECEELVVEAKCKLDVVEEKPEGYRSRLRTDQLRQQIEQMFQVLIVMLHWPCFYDCILHAACVS
jgi:hypothetical protein